MKRIFLIGLLSLGIVFFGISQDFVTQKNPVAGLTISAVADVGVEYEMAIVEAGVAQEVRR